MTLIRNVIPVGLVDARLLSTDALAKTEVAITKLTDKRNRAEHLR